MPRVPGGTVDRRLVGGRHLRRARLPLTVVCGDAGGAWVEDNPSELRLWFGVSALRNPGGLDGRSHLAALGESAGHVVAQRALV